MESGTFRLDGNGVDGAEAVTRASTGSWPLVDNWGVAAFELVGSLLCIARGLVGRGERSLSLRAVPLALGAATLAWALGDFAVAANASEGSGAPLLANILYLGFYPLTYIGVMLLLRLQVRRFGAETWLDGDAWRCCSWGPSITSAVPHWRWRWPRWPLPACARRCP